MPSFFQRITDHIVPAYQLYQVSRYLQQLILSILLVKAGLSLTEIGTFEIWLFVITILTQFWISGFKDSLVSRYHQAKENQQDMLLQGLWSFLALALFSVLVFWILLPWFLARQGNEPSEWQMIAGALYIVCISLGNYPETILLLKNMTGALLRYTVFSSLFYLILCFIFFFFETSLTFIYLMLLMFAFSKSLYLFTLLPSFSLIRMDRIFSFMRVSLPFVFIAMVGYGMEMLDGFLVVHFFETDFFPIYKYGARELPVSALLMSSMSIAMIPSLSNLKNTFELKSRADRHMHWLFPISILLIWISQPLFVWVYNETFSESAFIFNIYLVILGSRVLLPHSILLAHGHQRWVLWSGIVEFLANLLLSLWWVRLWGLPGLVGATVVAYYVQKMVMLYKIKREFNLGLADIISVKWWVFYQGTIFLSLYLNHLWLRG